MRRLILAALIAVIAILPLNAAVCEITPEPTAEPEYDVDLTIFLFDICGGCGVDSPGCGNCKDIVRYHAIIKEQLGDRLYDGTIHYRMHNNRLEANDRLYDEYFKIYGMPENLYGHWPVSFIGDEEKGVWLVGELMLDYVGEYLDKYLECEDMAALQEEIDELHVSLYPEDAPAAAEEQ